jgi:hypothetical protein
MVLQKKKMAVKFFLPLILSLFFLQSSLAQDSNIRLIIADYKDRSISNSIVVDSFLLRNDVPLFHPNKPLLYYSKSNAGQSLINLYDVGKQKYRTVQSGGMVVQPKFSPDGKFFSFITASTSGDNELRIHSLVDSLSKPKVYSIKAENYQLMDDNNVLIVEAGEPNSLQLVSLRPTRKTPVAKNVSTVLKQLNGNAFGFIHKLTADSWSIKRINSNGRVELITETLPDAESFDITAKQDIIMASENKLYILRPGTIDWKEIPVSLSINIHEIIAFDVDSSDSKIALLIR